jgi:cephalosporin hydroxylase
MKILWDGGGNKKEYEVDGNPVWPVLLRSMEIGLAQILPEFRMFVEFVKSIKPQCVLEIGTERGGSFYAISTMMNGGGLIISVDLPREFLDIEKRDRLLRTEYVNSVFLHGSSHDTDIRQKVEDSLSGRSLDLLYIDGDHTYKGVRQDYLDYSPMVKNGGWIVFHDINPSPKQENKVDEFWSELEGFKFEFSTYSDSGGFGLWRKD